jgi:maleate isomerase
MIRIGMLTPSSNVVLEPVTYSLIAGVPGVTAHFSRFKVTEIALSPSALGQFQAEPILAAAELLVHAKCDVIAWNGTSASWLGLDSDERLVNQIERATGVKAATCVLGYRELFSRLKLTKIGLVSPYTDDVQTRIMGNWSKAGLTCPAERHAGISDNFSFSTVTEAQIAHDIRDVAAAGADCAVVLCTNMRGAVPCAELEPTLGIPLLDSVTVTLWAALDRLGADKRPFLRWGRIFAV